MPISREAVIWGFRLFLGRDPGTEEAIAAHLKHKDEHALARTLLASPEFAAHNRFSELIELRAAPARKARAIAHRSTSAIKVAFLGNCQGPGLGQMIQAMTGDVVPDFLELLPGTIETFRSGEPRIATMLAESDLVLMHPNREFQRLLDERLPGARAKIRFVPTINYNAFHPDLVYVRTAGGFATGPMEQYQSSIAFYGWSRGLDVERTARLFNEEVFEALGFFEYPSASRAHLVGLGAEAGLPLDALIDRWNASGCWMHSINHPKGFVLADVARAILAREGIDALAGAEEFVTDELAQRTAWPVYPEIGRRLGVEGSYLFKKHRFGAASDRPVMMMALDDFLAASFASFERQRAESLACDRVATATYARLDAFAKSAPQAARPAASAEPGRIEGARNPYDGLPDHRFWRRSIERSPMSAVDPVVRPRFTLTPQQRIATAGSCFAQHISRALHRSGFNYFVAEVGELPADEALRRNFGVFSARYGNLYTARQLLQLFDRAHGAFEPRERAWRRADGRHVDPFRPQVEPDGFATPDEVDESRDRHLAAVRSMFERLDVFVFTLGLTEAWRDRADGAVFPVAPGVVAGSFDPARHESVNFGVAAVVADLNAFIGRLAGVNPGARLILTVSPVPLIATFEDRHVLVSTAASKAILRAAADQVERRHPHCAYFPSYEIVTGNFNRGAYFERDLRSIAPVGVDHVMRLFLRHYSSAPVAEGVPPELARENDALSEVVCDEEAIDRS